MSARRSLLVTVMTSDEKTLAFLARRVSSLEKNLEATRNDILGNQRYSSQWFNQWLRF